MEKRWTVTINYPPFNHDIQVIDNGSDVEFESNGFKRTLLPGSGKGLLPIIELKSIEAAINELEFSYNVKKHIAYLLLLWDSYQDLD